MTKGMRKRGITAKQIEKDLETLFRKQGRLLPTHESYVLAEGSVAGETFEEVDLEGAFRLFDRAASTHRAESPTTMAAGYWSHPSVLTLGGEDPIKAIVVRARQMVLDAIERGWKGPPYDPFALAVMRGVQLLPTQDVIDARTRSDTKGQFTIEFNPSRPLARTRYSIAHEIGHTLFPDCAIAVRNRATHQDMGGDDWQLEMLCNMAAAEILMPLGTLQDVESTRPSVDKILDLRRRYLVSCEAVMIRLTRLTGHRCIAFAARRETEGSRYQVEYRINSSSWRERVPIAPGFLLPKWSKVTECTAIGVVQRAEEDWITKGKPWYLEYLGVSPYTGEAHPRVIGIAFPNEPEGESQQTNRLRFVKGDATEPLGAERKILLQVVNDKALIWGVGFGRQVRKKWPHAQSDFTQWVLSNRRELKLGAVHFATLRSDLGLASLVAQHGYGPAKGPRLRYASLFSALEKVATVALRQNATIHMPRIGSGEAGGSWPVIEEIVQETLTSSGVNVTVYDLPSAAAGVPRQPAFEFPRTLADEIT